MIVGSLSISCSRSPFDFYAWLCMRCPDPHCCRVRQFLCSNPCGHTHDNLTLRILIDRTGCPPSSATTNTRTSKVMADRSRLRQGACPLCNPARGKKERASKNYQKLAPFRVQSLLYDRPKTNSSTGRCHRRMLYFRVIQMTATYRLNTGPTGRGAVLYSRAE